MSGTYGVETRAEQSWLAEVYQKDMRERGISKIKSKDFEIRAIKIEIVY